jgi:hypothetical protein
MFITNSRCDVFALTVLCDSETDNLTTILSFYSKPDGPSDLVNQQKCAGHLLVRKIFRSFPSLSNIRHVKYFTYLLPTYLLTYLRRLSRSNGILVNSNDLRVHFSSNFKDGTLEPNLKLIS